MKYAYFLRAFVLVSFLLVACESQEMKSLLERQDYFDRQIAIYEERVQKSTQKLDAEKKELEDVTVRAEPAVKSIAAREAMLAEIRELIGSVAGMESTMLENAGLIQAYKSKFEPKTIPNETNLGDLFLLNGFAYKGVVVKASTATHLNIAHSAGFSQIPFTELPDAVKSRIVVAPVEISALPNPSDVIARKPVSIKSEADYAADQQRAIDEQDRARGEMIAKNEAERSEMIARNEAERAEIIREQAEREERDAAFRQSMDAYMKESASIDGQIRKVQSEISSLERQRSNMEFANSTGTVRIAKADFVKKLKPFDDRIQELNAQIGALQGKKSKLVMPTR